MLLGDWEGSHEPGIFRAAAVHSGTGRGSQAQANHPLRTGYECRPGSTMTGSPEGLWHAAATSVTTTLHTPTQTPPAPEICIAPPLGTDPALYQRLMMGYF